MAAFLPFAMECAASADTLEAHPKVTARQTVIGHTVVIDAGDRFSV